MIELRTFGAVDLRTADSREVRAILAQPKRLALLVYLAVAPNGPFHRRDSLLGLLWPEADQARARASLSRAIHFLRSFLGDEIIVSRGDNELAVDFARLSCDAVQLKSAVLRGDFASALELYRGDFLEGFFLDDVPEFEHWVDNTRNELRESAAGAARTLAEQSERSGNPDLALHWSRRALSHAPYDEAEMRRALRLLDRSGDRAGALDAYHRFARRLREDLEIDPSPATRELIVAMTETPSEPAPAAVPATIPATIPAASAPVQRRRLPALALVTFVGVVLIAGLTTYLLRGRALAAGGEHSIAVLPFADLSPGQDNQYLSDGIADELISALSEAGALRVTPRTSSFSFRRRELSVPEIARKLNVATVLEGSVLRERDRLRINVQLVDGARGFNLWSRTYDQQLSQDGAVIDDLFKVQSDIAAHVIDRLDVRLRGAERRRIGAAPADNHEAYTLYLKGRYFWNKRTEQDIQRALDYYQQAVDLDPGYALAWAGIADAWIFRGWYAQLAPNETFPKAKHAALRALEFDSTLAEAHASLAHIHFEYDHDWAAAEREYLRAILLKPMYSVAHHWYGGFLGGMGRHAQALAHADTALVLDPLSAIIQTWQGLRYYFAGRYNEAVAEFQKALELDDNFAPAHWHLSWAYLQMGRAAEAVEEAKRASIIDKQNVLYIAAVGYTSARAGQKREALATLARLTELSKSRYVPAYDIALIHLALGDRNQALSALERAYAERSVMIGYMRVDPRVDEVRGNSRFKRLLHQAALDN
jgi:DNA-binding SARP family transcriptional activator/TolB-like protein